MFERGKEFERGRSPLSFGLPSPAKNSVTTSQCLRLERGYRGQVGTDSQKQTEPLIKTSGVKNT
jgi:hypothetical protein